MSPVLVCDEIDSTNAEARRRGEGGERGPVWLMARRQSAGRGRRGRAWDGGEGNLMATLLLTLDKPPLEAAQLAFVAALAVARAVDRWVPPSVAALKWPNDLLLDGRKACGMLVESGPAPAGGLWLAVGIGLNLATYPQAVERPATAVAEHLRPELAAAPSPDLALSALDAEFQAVFALWLSQGFGPVREAWTARAYGLGGPCTARLEQASFTGVAEGLDADGALLLRLPDGALRRIAAGEVFFGSRGRTPGSGH